LSTKDSATTGSPVDAPTDAQISSAIVERLADRLGLVRYELWFSGSGSVEFADSTVFIRSESNFTLNRLQNKFGKDVREVVNAVCGAHVEIEFSVRPAKQSKVPVSRKPLSNQACLFEVADPAASNQAASKGAQFADSKDVAKTANPASESDKAATPRNKSSRSKYSLKDFWFGSSNRIARAGVEQVTETPDQFTPLLIHGPSGTGKSHLLEAVTNFYRRRLGKKRCVYLTAEQFTSLFVGALRDNRGLPVFRQKYRDLDLFAIDDIQFLAGKTATLNEFQFTLDTLVRQGKQVILSSDRSLLELSSLGSDLVNRLAGGLSCPLTWPDHEGRVFIINRMCRERNFKLPVEVVNLVAGQITRDVRRLSGAVNRLRAVSISHGQPAMTVDFAAEALKDLLVMSNLGTSMMTIESAVCELTGVKPADLRSSSRRKTISSARMLAMYLAREHTNSALSEIGDYFGNRSHSTVIAAQKKIASMIADNAQLKFSSSNYPVKDAIEQIRSKLRVG
jgi:chromosomal replication initiator protein